MKTSFRRLLNLSVSILLSVLISVILVVSLLVSRNLIINHASAQLRLLAEFKSSQVEHWLGNATEITHLISDSREMQDDLSIFISPQEQDAALVIPARDRIMAQLTVTHNAFPDVKSISLLHPLNGRVLLASDPALEGRVRHNEEYFEMGQKELFISPVVYSVGSEAPVVYVSAPIHKNNKVVAVMVVELNISDLDVLISSPSGLGKSSRAYLVDSYGFYVTTPTGLEGGALRKTAESVGVRHALAGETGSVTYLDPRGKMVLGLYTWLPEASMGLLVEIEESELISEVWQAWTWIILFNLFILILVLLAVRYLANWLVTPLEKISQAAIGLRAGDLGTRAPLSGPDEIERLATIFNEMAATVQHSHSTLEGLVAERTSDLENTNKELQREITEHKQAEEEIRLLNASLEERVEERTQELRDMQEQLMRQERLAVLGQLAGSVGHELRNPLGVISNAIYFLKAAQPDAHEKIKEYLNIIEREIRISDKIVTDLLDFTRIKSAEREPVSVSELIKQTLERFPAPESIEVILDLPADLPQIHADPQQIVQVLGNLVLNACQAISSSSSEMISTGGKLAVSSRAQGDEVRIDVQDNGIGISPENMKKLFEPLFTTKTKGIGLGLAVSKKLIEANGGRIEVQSKAGDGSTFTLYIPTYKAKL